ncbi:MAG: glycosyltransferase [Anaerolineae bacterium]|nr:glycosyltransferase [Candidatus Roseilinea sp.]MDW8448430.1 glycosyltransferase [Anaerolineae bacterium]
MPKVSILIATYNRADLLPATLDSALTQTYRDIEVIVSDNASTDNTPELMQTYVARDPRVKYIRRSVNEGPIVNYHTALKVATGDYIAFLDSDDLFHPTKIERQLECFNARPLDMGLVHTHFYYIDGLGRPTHRVKFLSEGDLFEPLLRYEAQIWFGSVLFRRKCIERTGLLDASVIQAADVDYLLRATRLGFKVGCVREALYSHRHHSKNQSANVAGLAEALFTIYTRIYTDPEVAKQYGVWKEHTFANLHLDCAGRFLAAGQPEQAREHVARALTLRPEWGQTSQIWIQTFLCGYALGPTCDDPVAFVTNWFDHLPRNAAQLSRYRNLMIALAHIGVGLRAFHSGDVQLAHDKMTHAIEHCPELPKYKSEFIALVDRFVLELPEDDPVGFVNLVLNNWPDALTELRNVFSNILSDISVADAFCAWERGDWSRVKRRIVTALRYHPGAALNRGVMSIFTRSVAHSLLRRPS